MDTPLFFAWDDLTQYADGVVSTLNKQVSWAAAGTFQDLMVPTPADDFTDYSDGTVSTLAGGTDWLADAVFTIY